MDTIEHKNYSIAVNADEMPEDPRNWDNLGKLVLSHKRYNLANEININFDNFGSWDEVEEHIKKDYDAKIILPVYMYDHSGIALNTGGFSCQWDSGAIGFVFVSSEDIKKEYSVKRISKKLIDRITNCLRSEVETYSQYLNGEVYGYVIKDSAGEVIDSCAGFYGYDFEKNGLLEEAKSSIDYTIKTNKKTYLQKVKSFIKARIPLNIREMKINELKKELSLA